MLPLLKAFFVLCEARTAHLPAPAGAAGARRAASLDISRGASMDVLELISQPSAALSTAPEKAVAEAHLPFLRWDHVPTSLSYPSSPPSCTAQLWTDNTLTARCHISS